MSQLDSGPALPRPLSPQRLGAIRKRLLNWYLEYEQSFPWREARDPYAALVAAVAAQQTQMSRVLEIYERWMAAFPSLQSLAAATDADALRVWGRAGYPRRALYLRRAAQIVQEQHGGVLPVERAALEALPGVGPFTAAIVLNFGYGVDAAAIDTNIVRVLGRVLFGALQPSLEVSATDIRWATERMLPKGQAMRWNPALMDFGASICAPTPRCPACPLQALCVAAPRFLRGERASAVRAQPRFQGSQRQLRGVIMAKLRESGGPLSRDWIIAETAREMAVKQSRATLAEQSLLADGLLRRVGADLVLGSDA